MSEPKSRAEKPRHLRLHASDNVAMILSGGGVAAGTPLEPGLAVREAVPQAHKVAIEPIEEGTPVRRYGQVIGIARRAIPAGSWVREKDLVLPAPPALDRLPRSTAVPPPAPPLEGYTFEGYKNADGSVGTRNLLGITTTVQCVTGVLEHAVGRIRAELLPRYPNVDDVVALSHDFGCGVAFDGAGVEIPIRTVRNLARNPNLGGQALVVGLGCEMLQPAQVIPEGAEGFELDEPFFYRLQDASQGFGEMVTNILAMAERRLARLDRRRRETCPASALVLGMQCGGSDAFSGITANPALGFASDLLVRAGATVMFSEVTEVRDAVHLMSARARNEEVAEALIHEMAWYDRYLERGLSDRAANTSPGNKTGGLSNIVEKALGSVAKSGQAAIDGVIGPGERVKGSGLHFCATPASDFVCGTLQLAAGMNLHVFTTGRGTPYGLAMAPVIKVSTRSELAERWPDLIDVDAGRIASGEKTVEELGWELFHLYLEVASGKSTWAERHRIHNALALFNPAPLT